MNKYDQKFMDSAIQWATYSYCKRKQVGAVLTRYNREIASGYNGTITGSESNTCEDYFYECPHCHLTAKTTKELFTINKDMTMDDPYAKRLKLFCNKCNSLISLDLTT